MFLVISLLSKNQHEGWITISHVQKSSITKQLNQFETQDRSIFQHWRENLFSLSLSNFIFHRTNKCHCFAWETIITDSPTTALSRLGGVYCIDNRLHSQRSNLWLNPNRKTIDAFVSLFFRSTQSTQSHLIPMTNFIHRSPGNEGRRKKKENHKERIQLHL